LIGAQIAFGSLPVAGKLVFRTLEPGSLALARLAGAAIVFGILAFRRRHEGPPMPFIDWLKIAGCACLGIFGNQVLFLYGLRLTGAVNATVLVSTIPIFTVLVAILLRREEARASALVGVSIACAGVLWLVGAAAFDVGGSGVLGDVLIVVNSLCYALYLVLVRGLVARYGSVRVVAIGFAVGALLALPIGAPSLIAQSSQIRADVWWLTLYVVLVPTVFTYLANAWALRFVTSSTVAVYVYVQPVVAAVLAWIFLDEVASPRLFVTAVAVFIGVWLVSRPSTPRPATR
jgi:drug/metabolite transporter (DMT)-like permease